MTQVLRGVSIDNLVPGTTPLGPRWAQPGPLLEQGAEREEDVRLQRFPVLGDAHSAQAFLRMQGRYEAYSVRRMHLLAVDACRLAGSHLVAVLPDGRFLTQTTRGPSSLRRGGAFKAVGDAVLLRDDVTVLYLDEPHLVLGAKAASGYFHWMTEVVPRLVVARRTREVRRLPVLMRPAPLPFQTQTLEWLDVHPRFAHEPVIDVPRAVLPTFPVHPRRMGRYSPHLIEVARQFADDLLPRVPSPAGAAVYVSRADALKRHVVNEDEVQRTLEAEDVTCLTLTGRPVEEQVALFRDARVVVAQHGAALTNLLFCRPATRVVELYPRDHLSPSPFWSLASLLGLDYRMLLCDVAPGTESRTGDRKDGDLLVDVKALRSAVTGT